jgi:hypothetical protein
MVVDLVKCGAWMAMWPSDSTKPDLNVEGTLVMLTGRVMDGLGLFPQPQVEFMRIVAAVELGAGGAADQSTDRNTRVSVPLGPPVKPESGDRCTNGREEFSVQVHPCVPREKISMYRVAGP